MIRFRIKEKISDKEFSEGRRITLNEIAESTRIHRVTLSKIANERGYNAGIENVDRLCAYFGCQPGDLMEFIPTQQRPDARLGTKEKGSKVAAPKK